MSVSKAVWKQRLVYYRIDFHTYGGVIEYAIISVRICTFSMYMNALYS